MSEIIPKSFYFRSTPLVARELIGCILWRKTGHGIISAKIVETEAYTETDPASHSFSGKKLRNKDMYLPGGSTYVYLIYGIHHCLNIVTEPAGYGCAVLLRAAQPLTGLDIMIKNRNKHHLEKDTTLCRGPGNLAKSFGIELSDSGIPVWKGSLIVKNGFSKNPVISTPRIGISKGKEYLWRFFESENKYVSGKKF
jgi:DNA-3-methyladenine glycosylase